ncbi:hypothetical protein EPJ79_10495 [Brachyspira aalborgi]|uniref:Uncharacterized protein n=1 Tax=Brachyspira aalborgi TaxID=29522 RepID=A0A5C8D8Y7_9SPIR|nr:hypothetical protein [Brachyspira aalborgi]TXJ21523.1 hypothetical protein EPJ79_10495 [Brachyspira aalborgi]
MVRFLRKIFVVLPFILRLIFMFKPDYINFIQTIYNKNNNLFLIIILIISILYIINLIAFIISGKNRVNIKYVKGNDTFKLKGKKDNFIITKNGKHQFLVKDGMIIAYKPTKLFSRFKYYKKR